MAGTIRVDVLLGDRSYPVLVGAGARHQLATVLREADLTAAAQRAAVVTQPGIGVEVDPGIPSQAFEIPDGEQAKELDTIGELCSGFTRFGLTRRDVIVAVGGGVVTDVAGFAAAVYHRGIAVVHVATTLLGQIDAAVGGKTGVNLAEGKNLVGAFWQPAAVLCDTEVLESLPERELRAGYGELAKYHFIPSPAARPWLAKTPSGDLGELPIDERVAACVAIKAEVVASDETESGRRALLNYGHTLAHALEIEGRFDLRHGEAVAVGLRYAALVARLLGRIDDARVAEHERVLAAYGLDAKLPAGVDADEIIELFGRDKKATDGITFVLDGPDGLEVVPGVEAGVLRSALDQM